MYAPLVNAQVFSAPYTVPPGPMGGGANMLQEEAAAYEDVAPLTT